MPKFFFEMVTPLFHTDTGVLIGVGFYRPIIDRGYHVLTLESAVPAGLTGGVCDVEI